MKIDEESLRKLGVELIVLFGSRALDKARPDSDYDVGVQFAPDRDDGYEALEAVRAALGGGGGLDLVSLNHANALLLREVALDGVAQFEKEPGAIERFRLRAHKRYMDTAKFRRMQREALDSIYG